MSAALVKSLLRRPILFNRALVEVADGSIYAALFLGQALYWTDRCDAGWFYKKSEEWEAETALSPKQQSAARAILRAKGYIREKQSDGTDRKLSYCVDTEKLAADLQALAESKELKRSLPNRLNGVFELADPATCIDTESTAESTAEIHARRPAHEDGFEEFWTRFPRKVAKVAALKTWVAKSKAKKLPAMTTLFAAVHSQATRLGWFDGSCPADKIPHPSTWLHNERWNDELEVRLVQPKSDPAAEAEARRLAILRDARESYETAALALCSIRPDGWTPLSRCWVLDDLDALQSPEDFEARLDHVRALIARLRALGAFPLVAKRTDPGLIFPACGGGPWRPELTQGGWTVVAPESGMIVAAIWPISTSPAEFPGDYLEFIDCNASPPPEKVEEVYEQHINWLASVPQRSPGLMQLAKETAERIAASPPPTQEGLDEAQIDFVLNSPLGEEAGPNLRPKNDDRPATGCWSPGEYTCVCTTCGDQFWGDKRAVSCADCAYGGTGTIHDPGDGSVPTYFPGPNESDANADCPRCNGKPHFGLHHELCMDCVDELESLAREADDDDWDDEDTHACGDRSEP